jgi:hypothetical protein
LTNPIYARDFNEVKAVGGKVTTVRTADQTEIARFWFEGPGNWNTIARAVATTRKLDAADSARLLALMNLAMADSYIAGWKIRYVYDFWRPITAIREGDNDGNDATAGDPTWDSHQNTPAVSDYPSTQSTFSAAAAVVAGRGSGHVHGHEREAVRGTHAVVHELLPGGAGERRFANLCGHSFPKRLRGRTRTGTQGRAADRRALLAARAQVTAVAGRGGGRFETDVHTKERNYQRLPHPQHKTGSARNPGVDQWGALL